jgi:hypothetical protein
MFHLTVRSKISFLDCGGLGQLAFSLSRNSGVLPRGKPMTPEERQRMNSLSLRIQEEKDYCRFEGLVGELNEVIGCKQRRFSRQRLDTGWRPTRPWKVVTGFVRKLLTSAYAGQPERVEISIPDADDLFREIRIANSFLSPDGRPAALKAGVHVQITLEADEKDTIPKAPHSSR